MKKIIATLVISLVFGLAGGFYMGRAYEESGIASLKKNLYAVKTMLSLRTVATTQLQEELADLQGKNEALTTEVISLRHDVEHGGTTTVSTKIVYRDKFIKVPADEPNFVPHRLFQGLQDGRLMIVEEFPIVLMDDGILSLKVRAILPEFTNDHSLRYDIDYQLDLQNNIQLKRELAKDKKPAYIAVIETVNPETNEVLHRKVAVITDVPVLDLRKDGVDWWNPKLDLGLNLQYADRDLVTGASLGLSLFSYGADEHDISWRFLRLGASVDSNRQLRLEIAPSVFNVGKMVPVADDLWIAPSVTSTFLMTDWSIGFLLSTTL